MVAPIHALDIVQVGLETTRGTLVPATAILDMDPGGATFRRDPTLIKVRKAGSLATMHRSYAGRDQLEVEVEGSFTYNWAPWWFNLFLGPLATGTGAGADKTWDFVPSDTLDNLKSASLEISGRDTRPTEFKLAGCVGQRLSLQIRQDATWHYTAVLFAATITEAAKTGALSDVASIVDVLGPLTKIYIDSSSAFGTTQKTGVVLSADIEIVLGASPRWTLDAGRSPTRIAIAGPREISASMVVEWNDSLPYTAMHAGTAQRVRIQSTGPVLGSTTYLTRLDIPGVWETHDFGDDDGVVTTELELTAQYDSTPAADVNARVINAVATLP